MLLTGGQCKNDVEFECTVFSRKAKRTTRRLTNSPLQVGLLVVRKEWRNGGMEE